VIGVTGGSVEERSQAFIDAVTDMFARIGIPDSLSALGLADDQQDYVAEYSLQAARLIKNNPRPLDLAAMQIITRAAFKGDRASLEAI
jgi:alcohol dehydrogenase class IV